MTRTLTILFIFNFTILFGQSNTNSRVLTENPALNKLFAGFENKSSKEILDTLFATRKRLPDGQYFTYWDKLKKVKEFDFTLQNGNVNGIFHHWNQNGILSAIGTYRQDSLWTFKKEYFFTNIAPSSSSPGPGTS